MDLARFNKWRHLAIPVAVLLLFAILLLVNAWVVDDAYITFRTVDNFVHGHGLTWNPDERVQVYTHPLWMLMVSLFHFLTSEFFFTVVFLSCFLALAAVFIAWATVTDCFRTAGWKGYLLVLSLVSSKAVIDYASSGLENALSYLIAAIFLLKFIRLAEAERIDEKNVTLLFLLGSLAFLNRADTLILYLPALLYSLVLARDVPVRHRGRAILLGTLPAAAWILFSLLYYGYPFPNTAYAKVLSTGFPFAWRLHRGFEYLGNSMFWDSASYVVLAGACWLALKRRAPAAGSVMVGIVLYMCYVVTTAASATHMSGRFFAVPFFMAALLFAHGMSHRGCGVAASACLAVFIAWNPVSAIKFGTDLYQPYPQNKSYIDTKWYVLEGGAALLNWRAGRTMPDHEWYHYGLTVRSGPDKVHLGGAYGGEAIGYAGFAAGPAKHFIDRVGLADPLLARLPADRPAEMERWKSGHFHRRIPEGYQESLVTGENRIRDAGLKGYYDVVRTITRGRVFRWERLRAIVKMNLGRFDLLLSAENVESGASPHAKPTSAGY